ncbi:MAG: hypothetical protein IID18_06570 [Nitrospinae bacterium]|nr:hypothetical protein [Nitrospinota bacterium]
MAPLFLEYAGLSLSDTDLFPIWNCLWYIRGVEDGLARVIEAVFFVSAIRAGQGKTTLSGFIFPAPSVGWFFCALKPYVKRFFDDPTLNMNEESYVHFCLSGLSSNLKGSNQYGSR